MGPNDLNKNCSVVLTSCGAISGFVGVYDIYDTVHVQYILELVT